MSMSEDADTAAKDRLEKRKAERQEDEKKAALEASKGGKATKEEQVSGKSLLLEQE